MEKPETVRRHLRKVSGIGERIEVEFTFGVEFPFSVDFPSSLHLSAGFKVDADKTKSIRDIELMADKLFTEMLQATLLKCQDGIISN